MGHTLAWPHGWRLASVVSSSPAIETIAPSRCMLAHHRLEVGDDVVLARDGDLDALGDVRDDAVALRDGRVGAEHRVLVEVAREVAPRVDHELRREA